MKRTLVVMGALAIAGCAGAKGKSEVMTPEERLEEQLRIAEEQREEEDRHMATFNESETAAEEEAGFDEESANHEMRRAALNAVDCPNTFEKDQIGDYQPGKAVVTMLFANNGNVKNVDVGAPYAGTPVGECIVRAMGTVHVEHFSGPEVAKTWELEMQAPKPKEPAKK